MLQIDAVELHFVLLREEPEVLPLRVSNYLDIKVVIQIERRIRALLRCRWRALHRDRQGVENACRFGSASIVIPV